MRRIAIDCRFAALHAGLGRYTRFLVTEMLKHGQDVEYVLIVRNKNEQWIPSGSKVVEADIPHYSLAEQLRLPGLIKKTGADLLFSPHFNVPFFCPIPYVVTIHDLILHRYPNTSSLLKRMAYRLQIGRAIKRAQSIIAVSAFTSKELVDVYGTTAAKKTIIVPEGVDPSYVPASALEIKRVQEKFDLRVPYYLYVGNAKEHKNVRMLMDAFVQASVHNTELVLITSGPEFERLLPLPKHVRQLQNVSDEDLPALYSGADACVSASLYEGYYLPGAEALACGCPVIAVDRAAVPEIVCSHGQLVEPTVNALAHALQHPPAKKEPVIVGTWTKAAVQTEQILVDAVYKKTSV